jgi:DNA-directed RNA polymerase specialized sigma24 family protein
VALTSEHLSSLLRALGPAAAERYDQLHWRLVRLFQWERCAQPETLADQALDRLARRLAENEPIENLESYLFGIARLILREEAQRGVRQREKLAEFTRERARLSLPASDDLASYLERCLATLTAEQRHLVLTYYGDAPREQLAAALGLQINALRNRALRLREKLEKCVMSHRYGTPGGETR